MRKTGEVAVKPEHLRKFSACRALWKPHLSFKLPPLSIGDLIKSGSLTEAGLLDSFLNNLGQGLGDLVRAGLLDKGDVNSGTVG